METASSPPLRTSSSVPLGQRTARSRPRPPATTRSAAAVRVAVGPRVSRYNPHVSRRVRILLVVAVLAVAAGGTAWWWWSRRAPPPPPTTPGQVRLIAVGPAETRIVIDGKDLG